MPSFLRDERKVGEHVDEHDCLVRTYMQFNIQKEEMKQTLRKDSSCAEMKRTQYTKQSQQKQISAENDARGCVMRKSARQHELTIRRPERLACTETQNHRSERGMMKVEQSELSHNTAYRTYADMVASASE